RRHHYLSRSLGWPAFAFCRGADSRASSRQRIPKPRATLPVSRRRLAAVARAASFEDLSALGRPSHLAQTIIPEILRLPLFDSLQHEVSHEFGLISIVVVGRRSAAGWASHPVRAEIRRGDKRVDLADGNAILFQFRACRKTESQ